MQIELIHDGPLASATLPTAAEEAPLSADLSGHGQQPEPLPAALGRICQLSARLLGVPAAVLTLQLEDRSDLVVQHGISDTAATGNEAPPPPSTPHGGLSLTDPIPPEEITPPELASLLLHESGAFRAYLPSPVVASTGARGTLCALSAAPRQWTRADEEDMSLMSGLVVRELEVRTLRRLERARDQALDELERAAHLLSSERTTLEEQARELQKYAFALLRSNRELDQFAYVASHDLKAPLRGIASITEWLAEDLEHVLDEQSREHLRLLQSRVRRMEGLIDGILRYARAGRTREDPDAVDVGKLLASVIDMLSPPERFEVRVDGYMPVVITDQSALEQVFLNLIDNAVAHADGAAPVVTVSVTDEGGGWYEFSVTDNGPGIAPEHHDRIFSMFQTLSPKDRRETTGIGLSIVKRIVESQGGQVWVESEEGTGATFRFLWPERSTESTERGAWTIGR